MILLVNAVPGTDHVPVGHNRASAQQSTEHGQVHQIRSLGYIGRNSANNASLKGSIFELIHVTIRMLLSINYKIIKIM